MIVNLTPHALLFTLSAIGISEASYLVRKRIAAQAPVCPIGGGCETVLTSRYNRLFAGVNNDVAGLLFYLAMAVLTALLVISESPSELIPLAVMALLAGATIVSAALTFVQWRILHAWCFWCVMSAATVMLMDIIVLTAQII
jgi:uncharacterized membrane protein